MSDLYEPYEKLISLVVLDRALEVPENNILLRQLQFVCADIGYGKYCWNAECHYCEVEYRIGEGPPQAGLACRLRGLPGMRLTRVAAEIRYNMSEVLASAVKVKAR
jgi:hypothetical protein